jgi:hypothetical protein
VGPETHGGQGGSRREENSLGSGVSRGKKNPSAFSSMRMGLLPPRRFVFSFSLDFDMGVRRNHQGSMEQAGRAVK